MIDASAYIGPVGGSQFEGDPLPSSRLGSSSPPYPLASSRLGSSWLNVGIFLGYLVGTL
jgi:hypothetical protein